MKIPLSPMTMYAAMKCNGVKREEMDAFATYLEQLDDSESPRGKMSDLDKWFEGHIQTFRRQENILFRRPGDKLQAAIK
jgi:hypothetical protein